MEQIVNLHIETLPEGMYLATIEDVPGLVAQGRTIQETIEIARDVAKKHPAKVKLAPVKVRFDYLLMVSA